MSRNRYILFLWSFTCLLVSCTPTPVEVEGDGTFIDGRDSASYVYVHIGTQTWMAENLNYAGSGEIQSWCYDDQQEDCDRFGRLYNYQSALKACPDGWHLPSDGEWKILEMYLGMEPTEADELEWRESGSVAIQLKATWSWNSGGTGNNTEGFSALAGGFRDVDEKYYFIYDLASFWTSTYSSEEYAWGRAIMYYQAGIYRWKYSRDLGFSVRCIKD